MPGRERDRDDPNEAPEGRTMTNPSEPTTAESVGAKSIQRVRASDLLGPRGLLLIEHEGEVYTLRVTRNNRLILTK